MQVLLVEDDPEDAFLTRRLFAEIEHQQYHLDCVDNFEDALAALQSNRHEVCLLDYRLGSQTGIDLLREARAAGCQVPALMLTGQKSREVDLEASAAGAVDYLVKGEMTPALLERAVRYAIASQQRERLLTEAQTQAASILHHALDAIITADERGIILAFNPAAEALFDYRAAQVLGRELAEVIVPPSLREAHREGLARHLAAGEARVLGRRIEITALRADGSELPVEMTVTATQHHGKRLFTAFLRDISERQRSETALRESEARFRAVFQGAAVGIAVADLQGHPITANPALERMLGYSVAELREMTFPEFTHPEDALADWELFQEMLAGQRDHYEIEKRFLCKDGRVIWGHLVGSMVRYPEGGTSLCLGMVEDITERKRAEEERDQLFASSLDMLGIAGLDGYFKRINPAFMETLGYSEAELLAQPFLHLVHPDDAAATLRELERLGTGAPTLYFENRYRHKDGSYRWLAWRSSPNVERGLVYTVARDITPQKQMAEQLQQQLSILNGVTESATDAIFVKDTEGRYLLINSAGAAFLGRPVEEIIGRHDAEFFSADTLGQVLEGDRRALAGETHTREDTVRSADVTRTYQAVKAPLHDAEGQVIGLVGISRDVTAGKQAERELVEANRRVTTILESITDAFFAVDHEWRFTYVNREAERLLQRRRGELLDKNLWGEFAEAVPLPFYAEHQRAVRENVAVHFEEFYPPLSTWFEVNAYPSPDGLAVYFRDVTARRQAEEALRVSERRSRAIFEEAAIGIFLTDLGGQLIQTNTALNELLGYSEGELRWKHFSEITHPDDVPLHLRPFNEALAGTRDSYQLEKRYLRKDGQVLWGHLSVSTVRDAAGQPQFFVGMVEDITQRKQAEERNLAFQSLGQQLNEVDTPEAAARVVLDLADQLLGWDCCWLDLVVPDKRWTRTLVLMDLVDGHRTDVPPPTSLDPAAVPLTRRALREGPLLIHRDPEHMPQVGVDVHVPFGEVTRLSASIMCVPIRTREREVGALSIQSYTFDTYTEEDLMVLQALADYCAGALVRTQAEAAREQLQHQLVQAQKMKAIGNLAGGIAHDFNNMLAVINGYSELLLGSVGPDSPQFAYLREINKAGGRAAELTRQLLAFSRKQLLEPKVLDLNDTVRSVDKMLRRLIGEDIELVTLLNANLGRVKADPSQLEQVLMNLVVNARDAMPQGGKLVLRTREAEAADIQAAVEVKPGRYVALEVEDTGCGIKAELLEHIFEPFFTTKEQGKGTGLGLATVFGIVKQSGGYIDVTSKPGVGTRFTVYLPHVRDVPVSAEKFTLPALPSGNETILLVEDEPMVRQMVREVLTHCGYTVLDTMQGDDALHVAEAHSGPIHLLLTDVVMPRMSGRELAERLKAVRPEVQVLFMSGYTDDAVMRHGLEQAEVELLQKPFTHLFLAQRVRRLLDAARQASSRGSILLVDDDLAQCETLKELLEGEGYLVITAENGREAFRTLRSGARPDVILLDLQMPGMNGWVFRLEQQHEPSLADIPVVVISGQPASGVEESLKPVACFTKPVEVERLLEVLSQLVIRENQSVSQRS